MKATDINEEIIFSNKNILDSSISTIYIHIPFCKQACHYCNFHFSTKMSNVYAVVDSIIKEIKLRSHYLVNSHFKNQKPSIQSIYFGGGTPSILNEAQIQSIMNTLKKYYNFKNDIEITFEVNPDDISYKKLYVLSKLGINRLSIGIQSFIDKNLIYINRSHNSRQALEAYFLARDIGFKNISIDLIYGIPNSSLEEWESDVETAIRINPDHISCYCLTIEKNTYFGNLFSKGKLQVHTNEMEALMYDILVKKLYRAGYIHYEVSNFYKNNNFSFHNTNYWKRGKYIGIGPSAHSYDLYSRQYNVCNNKKYIQSLNNENLWYTKELLTLNDHINESIMTGLRTIWGCYLIELFDKYKFDLLKEKKDTINRYISQNFLIHSKNKLIATEKGFKLCDSITESLFV